MIRIIEIPFVRKKQIASSGNVVSFLFVVVVDLDERHYFAAYNLSVQKCLLCFTSGTKLMYLMCACVG